ncbi:proline--tRNA ligase [Myxococcota bacterium]|nr:proline--tRNA ligase [Myxococcota bacterium]MCZ7617018.1 proline--tRNA ligase [Myxococcota bacterium]
MRWSKSFIPTLRDDPADAEAISHRLLVRAGLMRQLAAGVYSLLPLGWRVCRKIERIVREEMERIGAQEFRLPALHPSELWQRSGRWQVMGEEMFRLADRRGAELCLGMTHEEVFASLAVELRSYRALPQIWYQMQTKFRDEPRPKSGLLRVREFVMKDSYSLDVDREGLDRAFQLHFDAYRRIFERCGLSPLAVEASSGAMGGSESIEFMVPSDAGEDWVASCGACGYAANVEKATSRLADIADPEPRSTAPERFATPGVRTIEELARFSDGAPAERQIKTLVYVLDGETALVLLRGDHALSEQKLADGAGAVAVRPATDEEIRAALGASAGSLGAVGVHRPRVLADLALQGRRAMTTGANEDGFHLRGVDVMRDLDVAAWLDLRAVAAGEACPLCGAALAVDKTIEVGHIFKLGTRYSEALGANVLDEQGRSLPIVMGSYGIGIGRVTASIVERCHDAAGITWPVSVAPFEVVVTVLNPKEVETAEVGERIYDALRAAGIDVLLDDRDERPGVKFKDADLVGIPYRIVVGARGLEKKVVELKRRRDGQTRELPLERAAEVVAEAVFEERH